MLKKHIVFKFLMVSVLLISCGKPKSPGATSVHSAQPEFVAGPETIGPMSVASLAVTGPYSEVGKSMGLLMDWIGKNKVVPEGGPFGIYFDDPTKVKPESTKYEICIPVPAETKGDKDITIKKFGPVDVVATIHVGPFDKVGVTYAKLGQWITNNNFQIIGPAHEFYIDDPAKVSAESLKTKIAFPVNPVVPGPGTK